MLRSRRARLVTLLALGVAACSGGGGGDSKAPTVTAPPTPVLTTVTVSLSASTVQVGQTTSASAAGLDQNGAAIAIGAVTWSSGSPSIATVGPTGAVSSVAIGQVYIVATVGARTGSALLTIIPVPVASVSIAPPSVNLVIGTTQQLTATTLDIVGNALTSRVVTWATSDSTKARVSTSGSATAVAAGTATITATSEGKSGTATITVIPPPVASVTVAPATSSLTAGATLQLTTTAKDAIGSTLLGRAVTWSSSDVTKATVSTGGIVTGVARGTVTITAQVDGVRGTAALAIIQVAVASVTLLPTNTQLYVGASTPLVVSPRDGAGNALTGRPVAFATANASVATVSSLGVVTGIAVGTTTVLAAVEGFGATTSITVISSSSSTCSTTTRPITVGQTVTSSLSTADCRFSDNSYFQRWSFTLSAPTAVRIDMSSSAVDPYLLLQDAATGVTIAQDDDGGGSPNARIDSTLAAGRYLIYANTYSANELGPYQLTLAPRATACSSPTPLAVPTLISRTITSASCQLSDGTYADLYDVNVTATTTLIFTMTSATMDTYLILANSSGAVVSENDDGAGGSNAQIRFTASPGHYTLMANTYRVATGAYQLTSAVAPNPCTIATKLTLGVTVNGALTIDDCLLQGGYLKYYVFTLATPSQVAVDMTSTAFDAFLVLSDVASGAIIATDDDGAGNSNPRIAANLPAGQYIVWATSYQAGVTGAFQVRAAISTVSSSTAIAITPTSASLQAGQTLQFTATVTGNANASVRWQSSSPTVVDVSSTGLARALIAGSAVITATSLADLTKSASATVTASASGSSALNLDISTMYLVQSVQKPDGSIPLIANRAALARVFVRGSQAGLAAAKVRVRVYQGASLLGTYTGTATPTTTFNEACCSADIALPGAVIRTGISVLADVDPDNTVTESNETDNAFPLAGTAKTLSVSTVPDFTMKLVPIRQKNGLTGTVSPSLANDLRSMWPLAVVNVTTRATFSSAYPPLDANNSNRSWNNLLRELGELRALDQSTAYYYGLVNLNAYTSGGIVGMASMPGVVGAGVDASTTGFSAGTDRNTFAHEVGHNFSLPHAPCADAFSPSNQDPTFPYRDGSIGVYGFDLFASNRMWLPTSKDIMSYCDNNWVSDYNYLRVKNYRASLAAASSMSEQIALISGTIDGASVSLEPVMTAVAIPDADSPGGRYAVEAVASDGRVLFRRRFNATEVADGKPNQRIFVVAVPYRDTDGEIASVTVQDLQQSPSRAARIRTRPLPRSVPGQVEEVTASRTADGTTSFTWNAGDYPKIIVRDRASGQVIAMGRGGQLTVDALTAGEVDVMTSNGASSMTRAVTIKRK